MRDFVSIAAATAVVGYDLMADHREQVRGVNRVITALALTGSAAAGDAVVEIFIGRRYVGRVTLQRTGTEVLDLSDWQPMKELIPAGEKLHSFVTSAPSTNPIVFHFITRP